MNPLASPHAFDRRGFLRTTLALSSGSLLWPSWGARAQTPTPRWRAAVLGHTGRGDYGHGLDVIFNDRADIEVVAVADPVADALAKAQERCRAKKAYADYRQLLEKERPQLVSVGPRHSDQHEAMVSAALQIGAHVIVEKPFTQTLAEADALIAVARSRELRIVVAHQLRLAPSIRHLKSKLDAGLIGRLISIRAHGKQDDRRAGGEDMIVLGTHLFDLMRYLAGDPSSCTAQIWSRGREATRADARPASEHIGPVLGDEIEAQFLFANGVTGTFTSRARLRETLGHWGLMLIGEKGVARILWDVHPRILMRKTTVWGADSGSETWAPIPDDPGLTLPAVERSFAAANRRVLEDWLQAIAQRREAACSGNDGAKALEMALGVFQAGLDHGRVTFPLVHRGHPLA